MAEGQINNHAAFIWGVADLLRGDYKQSEYGKVILPLTVIRRLDCVLEPTKEAVLAKAADLEGRVENPREPLEIVAGQPFYNTSPLTFTKLLDDPSNIADALNLYIGGFSPAAKDVIDKFDFGVQIERLRRANLLYQVVGRFAEIDLHPEVVSNIEMGYLYEELIRKFSELSNETAGEHFTPREVIRLMVNLLFIEDEDTADEARDRQDAATTLRAGPAGCCRSPRTTCASSTRSATGGLRPGAERRDLRGLPLGHDAQGPGRLAHRLRQLLLRGPPRGRDASTTCSPIRPSGWSGRRSRTPIRNEHETKGFSGRFGAGLPRINDGSLPLPAAHDLEDEAPRGGRLASGDRLQRLAALHRGGGSGRVRDPPLDHRERLARGGRRAARSALLQHRHLHLLLGRDQPQGRQSGAARCSSSTHASCS